VTVHLRPPLRPPRQLRVTAHVELISLIVLLTNLFTAHARPVSSLVGPVHGFAYLAVVITTWRLKGATNAARVLAVVPGAGGLLALRQLGRAAVPDGAGDHVTGSVPYS